MRNIAKKQVNNGIKNQKCRNISTKVLPFMSKSLRQDEKSSTSNHQAWHVESSNIARRIIKHSTLSLTTKRVKF